MLTTTGSLASTVGKYNPFRYRSYYYDTETGYYYLQSRYYDPTVGRFLNADGYVSTGQGFVGNNMFAYCVNNPVMGYDPKGEQTVISQKRECPDNILNAIKKEGFGDGFTTIDFYCRCTTEGQYTVYVFSELYGDRNGKPRGMVSYYYFKSTNYRQKYEEALEQYNALNAIATAMFDYANCGPLPVSSDDPLGMALSIAQVIISVVYDVYIAPKLNELYETVQYYKNKTDEIELQYVVTQHILGGVIHDVTKHYA